MVNRLEFKRLLKPNSCNQLLGCEWHQLSRKVNPTSKHHHARCWGISCSCPTDTEFFSCLDCTSTAHVPLQSMLTQKSCMVTVSVLQAGELCVYNGKRSRRLQLTLPRALACSQLPAAGLPTSFTLTLREQQATGVLMHSWSNSLSPTPVADHSSVLLRM